MSTAQETFDTVVAHLRKQNSKAEYEDLNGVYCQYLASDGKKCALGCLIPEDKYDKDFEGCSVRSISVRNLMIELGHNIDLLLMLQSVHDFVPVEDWEQNFKEIAELHRLQYTPV